MIKLIFKSNIHSNTIIHYLYLFNIVIHNKWIFNLNIIWISLSHIHKYQDTFSYMIYFVNCIVKFEIKCILILYKNGAKMVRVFIALSTDLS